jgi:hypothetical protein
MARRAPDPEVIVKVTYVTDPANARAAQDILLEGFRRSLLKYLHENERKEKSDSL